MKSQPFCKTVAQPFSSVKPPVLPQKALDALQDTYSRKKGKASVLALSQGELDVLELARQSLGWPSIVSLAHKYYPVYPYRKCWKRALEKCSRQRLRTCTLNIKYLLLAVITQVQRTLDSAYSGAKSLNRLVHPPLYKVERDSNRLVHGGFITPPIPGSMTEKRMKRLGLEVPSC